MSTTESSRPRLVLDAGGVLFAEGFRDFLRSLAQEAGQDPDELMAYFEAKLRNRLWRGEISEQDFWAELASELGVDPDSESWSRLVVEALPALPTLDELERWSQIAELWILSNHRHEWLYPLLEQAGIRELFDCVLVSSELGQMKPEPAIFSSLRLGEPERVLFVDDKAENVAAAEAAGVPALVADRDGCWRQDVARWLDG